MWFGLETGLEDFLGSRKDSAKYNSPKIQKKNCVKWRYLATVAEVTVTQVPIGLQLFIAFTPQVANTIGNRSVIKQNVWPQ